MNLVYIKLTAILTIGVLEGIALLMGHNGTLMGLVMAVIGGIAGYEIKTAKIEKIKEHLRKYQ